MQKWFYRLFKFPYVKIGKICTLIESLSLNGPDFPVRLVEPLLVPDRDAIPFLQVKN